MTSWFSDGASRASWLKEELKPGTPLDCCKQGSENMVGSDNPNLNFGNLLGL